MRLQVTRKTDLAIRSLIALDSAAPMLKGAALGEQLGTTTSFLAQVIKPLVRAGWVESAPGPTGGYTLLVDLTDLPMLEVVEAVEGPLDDGRCVVSGMCGNDGYCALHAAWREACDTLSAHLAATSVAAAGTASRDERAERDPGR